ncbi:hypothetical protein BJF80_11150 [Serinicoccus sp. CUA-874]|nr:hypothetical protein BJF80_11150 [Serinicoccus sp. CUA-874]
MGVSVEISLILQPGLPDVAVAALGSPVVSLLLTQSGRHTLLGSLLPSLAAFAVALLGRFREDVPRLVAFLPSFWLLVPGTVGLRGGSARSGSAPGTARRCWGPSGSWPRSRSACSSAPRWRSRCPGRHLAAPHGTMNR